MADSKADLAGSTGRGRAPWHLWLVGVLFLLLYAAGLYDYLMVLDLNEDYFASEGFGPAHLEYFSDYPVLPRVFWTIGIFTGVLAPVLLLLRLRWATWLALVAAVAQLALAVFTFGFMERWEVFGPATSLFDSGIIAFTFGLALYCHWMTRRGLLR
ncbi:lipid-A-disaccharide synthase-like uncharacterized protein [Lipingzhangella halophila]|uniref:Lipid-A-disaccharide synthase-like uncharacterized protein n=1 Tax=Lipingzhangella halophila TaxID=1783352 RepID=A0A7W7RHZ6_9ACTN|nr:hypothetical protein [Lipingzhangella halophila]MBB4932313.1 lipid-A-disaccharide synthase-like uncharacterized protein [Lipingzhangella halophila]